MKKIVFALVAFFLSHAAMASDMAAIISMMNTDASATGRDPVDVWTVYDSQNPTEHGKVLLALDLKSYGKHKVSIDISDGIGNQVNTCNFDPISVRSRGDTIAKFFCNWSYSQAYGLIVKVNDTVDGNTEQIGEMVLPSRVVINNW